MAILVIRDLEAVDIPLFKKLYGDSVVMRYLGGADNNINWDENFKKFLGTCGFEKGRVAKKIIYGQQIGMIVATKAKSREQWDLGMMIIPKMHNKGIGSETMLQMMIFLKETYSVTEFTGTIPIGNHACEAMVKKLGFTKIKTGKHHTRWLIKVI